MSAADRAALLRGLADIVARQQADPVGGGLEAVRQLNLAGASWSDMLPGPVYDPRDSLFGLIGYGYRTEPDPIACGRAALTMVYLATPAELAEIAVLTQLRHREQDEADRLQFLLQALHRRRAEQMAAA